MLIFTYYATYAYTAVLKILTYVHIMLNISYAHVKEIFCTVLLNQ